MTKKIVRKYRRKKKKSYEFSFGSVIRFLVTMSFMIVVYSCATVPTLQEESPGTFIKIPFVRVLIGEDKDNFVLSSEKTFAVECIKDGQQSLYYSSLPVKIENENGQIKVMKEGGNLIASHLDEVNIIPRGNKNRVIFNNKRYRGLMKVLPDRNNLVVIDVVYMEDYLRGVVPPELGKRTEDEIEAVKAQAIAARTYAISHLKQYPNQPYDMKSSIIDQVYEGFDIEDKLVNRAIDATAGEVLFYQDKFINAYYHSTCGGWTDDIDKVWDSKQVPYLKAVEDGDACSWSKYFEWTETFTEKQLRGRMEQYLSTDRGKNIRIGKIKDIQLADFSPGGRVANMYVYTDNDRYRFQKDRIRWVVGRTSNPDLILPSDRFIVDIQRDGDGYVKKVNFVGNGYGHGIGMCQCGAIGLSRKGHKYEEILKLYYTGVEIRKLY